MTQSTETVSQLTRPIIGIENRTPLEVFDIMCDRIDHAARTSPNKDETIAKAVNSIVDAVVAQQVLDKICAAMCKARAAVAIDPDPWVRELATDIASLIAVPDGWRTINSAPRDGTKIILFDANVATAAVGEWMADVEWRNKGKIPGQALAVPSWFPLASPTHWAPLPGMIAAATGEAS